MAGAGYKRWTPDEMLRIAVHALPLADTGDKLEMLRVGMRTSLPKARWKPSVMLKALTYPTSWARFQVYLTKAARMSQPERDRIIKHAAIDLEQPNAPYVEPPLVALPVIDQDRKRATRWTDTEWAMIARRVKYMQDHGDSRPNLGRVIFDAQGYELRPERQRTIGGLLQSQYAPPSAPGSKTNRQMLSAAQLDIGKLLKAHPFRPEGNFAAPPPAVEPAAAVDQITFQIPTTIAEVRAVQGVEPEPVPEAQATLQARIASQFAEQMRVAVEGMLTAHATVLADSMTAVIKVEMAAWAASLERSLHKGVHHVLQTELGGPVQAPGEPPALIPDAPPPEEPTERKRQLRVDVVGLVGQNIELVRKSFNGSVDLKFIDPDQLDGWSPHTGRHAVVTLKWVPHKAKNKLRTVGVTPHMVMGGVGSVIHAIEELARKEGVELAH